MSAKQGKLSIHSENIFPIIKKWLYSDHDIFMRELTSNAADAITKMKHLVSSGEAKNDEDYRIDIVYYKEKEILEFRDNGLGMSAEEIEKYINSIAFSGAEDFVKKFKDAGEEDQIIGHFGLGFYSAFMVAEKVSIDSLSYREGEEAAYWECDGGTDFKMDRGTRTERGTTVRLYLSKDGDEFKNEYKIKNTLNKYCNFMPYPIYFEAVSENEDAKDEKDTEKKPEKAINSTKPLYLENPSSVSEEQYKEFYRDTFVDFKEPLFWIHLNMDYPFRLKGILYFPKITDAFTEFEGQIKLYNTQVYVADNIKEIIPEFLMLLKGVIDCPDMPLNVSRSFLQNDGFVKKISDYISKKVSDKLLALFKTDRTNYESYWKDIHVFIKFGILREEKFYEKIKDAVLYKKTDGSYKTIADFLPTAGASEDGAEKAEKIVLYYSDDREAQATYIEILESANKEVFLFDERIDSTFINFIEGEHPALSFKRVDAGIEDIAEADPAASEAKESEEENNGETEEMSALSKRFAEILGLEKIKVELKKLKNAEVGALIVISEESRRIAEMMKMYSAGSSEASFPLDETLVLNTQHSLVRYLLDEGRAEEDKDLIVRQLYDFAKLNNQQLTGEKLQEFIKRSSEILKKSLEK